MPRITFPKKQVSNGAMDRWADGQMEGWTDGQIDKWTDEPTKIEMREQERI